MPVCGVSDTSAHIRHDREWRVHQHHGWDSIRGEMIVDLGGVEAGDGKGRKERGETIGAGLGEFIEDRHEAGAGRGFQHHVVGHDRGCRQCGQAEWQRGRELLEVLAFLRPTGLRGQESRDFRQDGAPCSLRCGFTEKCFSVFAQEQHRGDLAGFIGQFPVPSAGRIGCAEGRFHRRAQRCSIDTLAALKMGKQKIGGSQDRGRSRQRRDRIGHGKQHVHVGKPRESGRDKPGQRSLNRPDFNPFRPPSGSRMAA